MKLRQVREITERAARIIEVTAGRVIFNEAAPLSDSDRSHPEEMFELEIDTTVDNNAGAD